MTDPITSVVSRGAEREARDHYRPAALPIPAGFSGQPLARLTGTPWEPGRFLELAVLITDALAEVHAKGIVHKDIKPQNLLVDEAAGRCLVTGFELASLVPRSRQRGSNPALIEGTLPYMSPEQTGRMNRDVDSRADLYSLGVTFYEMLTGQLPFDAKDPLEWVYCHIARQPPAPSQVVPAIPAGLSKVVMKLLEKLAEDRYQSAAGLRSDLEECWRQWSSTGRIAPFLLGQRDTTVQLLIPQKLYGREAELAVLLRGFERVADTGVAQLMLVSGEPGIGKSALVREIWKPMVRWRGFFAAGKCDQFQRDNPYSTIANAFREIVLEILAEPDERLASWREALQFALGRNGQVVIDVIPQVELVIGHQPAVVLLPPTETRNRFLLALEAFVRVLAKKEHPVAIFLDDLQWADPPSLRLIRHLLGQTEPCWLYLIGAYRSTEVDSVHPLRLMADELRQAGATVGEIALGPLSREHLRQMVAETLRCSAPEAEPLALLLQAKTDGNPFFVVQFLTMLHEERLIELDPMTSRWRWNVTEIGRRGFTDNVVELMIAKLRRLPPESRRALELAACLGNGAELDALALALGTDAEETRRTLWEPVREGLLLQVGDRYEFLHDRVQQAAYLLIPEEQRDAVHLRIGRLLRANTPAKELETRAIEIVAQLNHGVGLMQSSGERDDLLQLNFQAGRRAKASIAYEPARDLLSRAMALLPADAWTAQYQRTFALHLERSECEYLCGHQPEAERLSTLAMEHARSDADRAKVLHLRLQIDEMLGKYDEALDTGRDALRLFGVALPEREADFGAAIDLDARENSRLFAERGIASIADAPEAREPRIREALGLLCDMVSSGYGRGSWFPLIVSKMVNLSLKHGNTEDSCFGYHGYATILASVHGEVASGCALGEASLALHEKLGGTRLRGALLIAQGHFIDWQTKPFSKCIPTSEKGFLACLEAGDLARANYSSMYSVWQAVEAGDRLDDVVETADKRTLFAEKTSNTPALQHIRHQRQFLACLKGKTRGPTSFDDATFDAQAALATATTPQIAAFHHIMKEIAEFIAGRPEDASRSAIEADKLFQFVTGLPIQVSHYFFHALTLAALHPQASDERRREYSRTLAQHAEKLALCAEHCPENFLGRHALVSAEIARIEGRDLEAMRLYEQAIRAARENGLIHNEAIALELASAFYRRRGFEALAQMCLEKARACYARWGADAKVKQLDQENPGLFERESTSSRTIAAKVEQLDLLSQVHAMQAVSGEITLEGLMRTLLRIVLEQSGARRGCLLLLRGEELAIEARAALDEKGTVAAVLEHVPIADSDQVPVSVVDYVRRTRERVILDDARSQAGRFSSDEYLLRWVPRSMLCLPLIKQAQLTGLLYLENDLVPGVFTHGRIASLELLATQAVISLDSALTYEALRESEARFRAFAETSSAGIVVYRERILYVNSAGAAIAGRSRDELQAMNYWELIHPAHRERMKESGQRRLRGEPVWAQRVLPVIRKGGEERWVEFSATRFEYDGSPAALGVFIDVTERRRAEEATRVANERFGAVLRAATAYSIVVTDLDGIIKVMNEGAELMLGYRSEELVDTADASRLHDPAELAARAGELGLTPGCEVLLCGARRGETETREWTYVRKDGRRLVVSLTVAPLWGDSGTTNGFIGIARDITAEKRLEEQLLQSRKMESVGLLAGGVAHDFNNLLTPILGFSYMLLDQLPPEDPNRADLEQIRQAAESAKDLTRRLLAFSHKQVIVLKTVDLGEVIRRFENMLRRTIREDVRIVVRIAAALGPVRADAGQIEQVLINLSINAQDAMPKGGVLTIEAVDIDLDEAYAASHPEAAPGRYVMLAVSDTGVGMDEVTMRRAFEPFFTTKEQGQGTGLGLSTVYGIVKQHGGSISVYSEKQRGSTFKVFLPRAVGVAKQPEALSADVVLRGEGTILVVEDHEVVRDLATRMLRDLGYRVMAAAGAEEAVAQATSTDGPIDLLLSDVIMPGMNGRELYDVLKRSRPELKVLYMSGYSANVFGTQGVLDESIVFLQKPFTLSSLSLKIRAVLDARG